MELANNTWNKGLLMDTHPMMLGNDSMTDCLNGTLISMNGNEVILQNDMGNRRIDHAFLPSGYEPVGIKEHGGVIYVASYNPITNKSLIGSFPSPERVIDINDDKNLKNSFDFDSFFIFKENGNILNDSTLNIPVMISDSFLIPLTPKNKLHVGDIFTVYSPHLSSLAPDLTNYDNILYYSKWKECTKQEYDEITDSNLKKEEIIELQSTYYKRSLIDKVYSPKNRKYTLLLGILNEQNNFNDITSSLVRWNSPLKEVTEEEYNEYKTTKEIRYYVYEDNVWKEVTEEYYNSFEGSKQAKYFIYVPQKIIRNLENKSQLYKFNTGYFIPDGFTPNKDIDGEPIDDANLIKSRKQIAANNFSYKLAGPLYLKVSYNHVHSFGYAINGTWDGKKATLKITGYFTYNCPDGVNPPNDNGDSDYYTFETGEPTNILFDFFDNNENTPNKPVKIEPDQGSISTSTCIYNKTTNLYTVTLVKEYTIENPGDIYNYVIGVLGGNYKIKVHRDPEDEESELIEVDTPFYIKDLSSAGQINLRLLNSGAITLKLYKFYNKAETHDTTMTLEFETYPKEGLTFEDMYLEFENINNEYDVRYLALHQPILNGKLVFSFNWLDSISNDAKGTEYDENVPYELANIKLKARQTYKVTIHYKDINTLLNLEINSTYDDGIDRWLLTTELFNDLYSSNLTDYCNKALTNGNLLFLEKLTVAPKYIESLFNVSYGDVTYYDPREDNHNQAPMYRATLLENDSLTLYLSIYFKKKPDYQEMDSTIYPEYLGELSVIVNTEDEEILNSETITKTSYEPLSHVWNPLRTIEALLERSDLILRCHTSAELDGVGDDEEDNKFFIFIYTNEGIIPEFPNYAESYNINDWVAFYKNDYNKEIYSDSVDEDVLTYTIDRKFDLISDEYYKLMLKTMFTFDYYDKDDVERCYRLGSAYGIVNNQGRLIFIKRNLIDINESDSEQIKEEKNKLLHSLINWNELELTDTYIYKLIGKEPSVKSYEKTINYSVKLDSTIGDPELIPSFGNLEFIIDFSEQPEKQICYYNNIDIVNEYRHKYLNKTSDSYIDINSGNKIINYTLSQSLGSFEIKNYNKLLYTGNYIYGELSKVDYDLTTSSDACYIHGYKVTELYNE